MTGYLSRSHAAAYLDMSPKSFDAWVRRHGVPFVRIGRTRRFAIAKLEAVLRTLTLRKEQTA